MARPRISQDVFRALADPTRRKILILLLDGEMAVQQIGQRFQLAGPSLSEHLGKLHSAGLVAQRRAGRLKYYSLTPAPLAQVREWLELFGNS